MNSVMLPKVLNYMYVNRSQAASVTHVKIVTAGYNSTTSGKMVTQQQDQLDFRGDGELRMGPHQLDETGYLGRCPALLPTKVRQIDILVLSELTLILSHD